MTSGYRDASAALRERIHERHLQMAARRRRLDAWLVAELMPADRERVRGLDRALLALGMLDLTAESAENIAHYDGVFDDAEPALARAEMLGPMLEDRLRDLPALAPEPSPRLEEWGVTYVEHAVEKVAAQVSLLLPRRDLRLAGAPRSNGPRVDAVFFAGDVPLLLEVDVLDTYLRLGGDSPEHDASICPRSMLVRVRMRGPRALPQVALRPLSRLKRFFHAFVRNEAAVPSLASFAVEGDAAFAECVFVGDVDRHLAVLLRLGGTLSTEDEALRAEWRWGTTLDFEAIADVADLFAAIRRRFASVALIRP